MYLVITS